MEIRPCFIDLTMLDNCALIRRRFSQTVSAKIENGDGHPVDIREM